jgi:hypothetical protein
MSSKSGRMNGSKSKSKRASPMMGKMGTMMM